MGHQNAPGEQFWLHLFSQRVLMASCSQVNIVFITACCYPFHIINFSFNLISSLPDNIFSHLGNLSVLSLKKNQLTDLSSANCFGGLIRLRILYLSANHIHTLAPEVKIVCEHQCIHYFLCHFGAIYLICMHMYDRFYHGASIFNDLLAKKNNSLR